MTNRIVVPANYSFEIIVKFDPRNGQSELQIRNRSGIQITMWQVAGLLIEHSSYIIKSLLSTGKVKQTPINDPVQEANCLSCGKVHPVGACPNAPATEVSNA